LILDELVDFDVDVKEIEQIIERTSGEMEQKIDWTSAWGKKYPVLTTYQEKVKIDDYAVRQLSSPTGSLPRACYLCQRETGKSFSFTFSGITHSGKSGKCTDAAGVQLGIKSTGLQLLNKEMEVLSHGESDNQFLTHLLTHKMRSK